MPRLELYDTVSLRSDPTLIGTIERTSTESEGPEALDEKYILLHAPVPKDVLGDFVLNGMPPRGYVFVNCPEEDKGSFLAREDDLVLLSRSFDLGDTVKRANGVTGIVVDVSDAYSIEPIWRPDRTLNADLPLNHTRDCLTNLEVDCPHGILSHVPGQELVHHQALFEEDFVCFKQWLGVVSEFDVDVVLQIDDSIVVLSNPDDLYLPIREPSVALVSLPEFDGNSRPDIVSAFQGYSWVLPIKYPRIGSRVVTSRSTLKNGRWVTGQFKPGSLSGTVIDMIPFTVYCQWISCNPFAALEYQQLRPPWSSFELYEDPLSYKSGIDLKINHNVRIIDLLSPPRSEVSRSSDSEHTALSPESRAPTLHQDFKVGDCVKFRDLTAASVKYQHQGSGQFNRIASDSTHGWDLNAFRISAKGQSVRVQWQDGRSESLDSNDLERFGGFEDDFSPADIVVNRAGMKMAKDGEETLLDFNEMTFFEARHSLHPIKVGVIQSVEHRDRIAKVRWFQKPSIILFENGNRISANSRLGHISDTIEEVSLYEVMTFPALDRHLRDVALLLPRNPSKRAMDIIKSEGSIAHNPRWTGPLASLLDPQNIFSTAREIIRGRAFPSLGSFSKDKKSRSRQKPMEVDWLGEIIRIKLDGTITVRLSGATPVRDVNVSFDEVLAIIHPDYALDQETSEDELWDPLDGEGSLSGEEEVEYEGGERVDDDTDDDNWVSEGEEDNEDEDDQDDHTDANGDVEMSDAATESPTTVKVHTLAGSSPLPSQPALPSFIPLATHLSPVEPPSFDILSISPPPDQYQSPNTTTPSSKSFLIRLRHEHKLLSTSLPQHTIYVRTYDSRLDLLRCLIIGPPDTPYEHAPFLIDLALPSTYPADPPVAHFHSWTSGLGRINPNLYEEGKICLSLLGTWPGKDAKEGWSKDATILQILVSLQGLVMVQKPFYNEAGFESEEASGGYVNESAVYSERAYVMGRGFVGFALTKPVGGLEDVLAWLYLPINTKSVFERTTEGSETEDRPQLLERVLARGYRLIQSSEGLRLMSQSDGTDLDNAYLDGAGHTSDATKLFLRPLSKGAIVMLKRQFAELEGHLQRWRGWELGTSFVGEAS
jgi:ubiquitin-conjugating enzyme E2 O